MLYLQCRGGAAAVARFEGELHRHLAGSFFHTILEWTSFCAAISVPVLSFVHFRLRREVLAPVIGTALFWSGCMDAWHTLASDCLVGKVTNEAAFIPLTWAIARAFTVLVLIAGAVLILSSRDSDKQTRLRLLAGAGCLSGPGGCAVVALCGEGFWTPQVLFPHSVVRRPWDLACLVLFVAVALPLFLRVRAQSPSVFSHALVLALMPQIATQIHMAFGSSALYDNDFNIAHLLKIVGYTVPLSGLLVEYIRTYQQKALLIRELREARDQALAGTRAKGQFLAAMSHEIRTPLNGVIGMNALLLETPLNREQSELAGTARSCGEHLLSLINDILDFSRIEAGKLELESVDMDVRAVMQDVLHILAEPAARKGLDLAGTAGPDVPQWARGDPIRLRQVLLNLAGNAIKFTSKGRVDIRLSRTGSSPRRVTLLCEVTDTGIGLDAQRSERLFEPFTQADASTVRKYGGTGLGLAISRQLVELMEGRIGVESEPGNGSRFWFTVSLQHSARRSARQDAGSQPARTVDARLRTPQDPPLRVLVAEDNSINQTVIVRMLQRLGVVADVAGNGIEAVEMCSREIYQAVFMDCQMPELDGYEACRRIRALPGRAGSVPIVAVTADVLASDRERCLQAGMNGFLPKPIRLETLSELLAGCAAGGAPTGINSPPALFPTRLQTPCSPDPCAIPVSARVAPPGT